jgi:Flp pilus assembly protein TadD
VADKAEKSLKNALKRNPEDTEVLRRLVVALRSADKNDQALSYLERYLTAHPEDFDVLILY